MQFVEQVQKIKSITTTLFYPLLSHPFSQKLSALTGTEFVVYPGINVTCGLCKKVRALSTLQIYYCNGTDECPYLKYYNEARGKIQILSGRGISAKEELLLVAKKQHCTSDKSNKVMTKKVRTDDGNGHQVPD